MKQIKRLSALVHGLVPLFATLALAASATAADWPQWRGPDRNGVSRETGWSAEGQADDVWTKAVGLGYSSVSVVDGRLYTLGYSEETGDTVFCLDAVTGEPIWVHSFPAKKWSKFHSGGTLTTPSVDGDIVYTLNREGRFHALGAKDGRVIWSRDLMKEFELEYPTWGFAASPLILGDVIVLNVGRIIAIRKDTGETLWKTRDFGHAYSTPADLEADGRRLLAAFDSQGFVLLDLADGREIGLHPWKNKYDVNAATPVIVGSKAFISSGEKSGCAMIECGTDGIEILWENRRMNSKMSGCVLVDGHLYGFDDAILKCIDLDGNEKWRKRGIGNGSLMASDGRLIVIGSRGDLLIAEATPDEYRELSRKKCLDGGVYWTMPVLVDGLIYCRSSEGALVCRDHRSVPSGDGPGDGSGGSE